MYNQYKEHYYYGGDILLPVDYTANWKKVEREVGRVRGREGVREGRQAYYIGRGDEVKGRDGGREGESEGRERGTEGGREGETKGGSEVGYYKGREGGRV